MAPLVQSSSQVASRRRSRPAIRKRQKSKKLERKQLRNSNSRVKPLKSRRPNSLKLLKELAASSMYLTQPNPWNLFLLLWEALSVLRSFWLTTKAVLVWTLLVPTSLSNTACSTYQSISLSKRRLSKIPPLVRLLLPLGILKLWHPVMSQNLKSTNTQQSIIQEVL